MFMKKLHVSKILFSSLVAVLFFSSANQALAHATPISYEPEAATILPKLPESVKIRFSERIEPKASSITVYGPDGSKMDSGEATADSADARLYGVTIKDGGQGTYTVSWQVVSSDDGHFTKGGFGFSVGKETGGGAPAGQIQIQHITTIPQASTISIELIGQALILGVLIFIALLWRPLKRKFSQEIAPYIDKAQRGFSAVIVLGSLCVLLATVSFIVLKTFDLQQLRVGDFATTLKTFLSTVDGHYALVRGGLVLLLGGIFLAFRKSIFKAEQITKTEWVLLALVVLMILIRARVSHAAASHFHPSLSIFLTALQLFGKELWVGGLVVFAGIVAPFLLRLKTKLPLAYVSTAFSKIMIVAFAAVGVAGSYVVWTDLKDPSFAFTTEWGSRLILLTMFGGALFALRLYHQVLVETSLTSRIIKFPSALAEKMLSFVGLTLKLEMLVGIALLGVTGIIIITTPPYATQKFTFEKSDVNQGAKITMSAHPYETSKFLITVEDESKHTELPVTDIVITLTNEEKSIGPIVAKTEQRFVGGYVFAQNLLSPPGVWKINISAQRSGSYDAVASFKVDYPKDIEASRLDPDQRSFGGFEASLCVVALLILGFSFLLYRFSNKLHRTVVELLATKNQEEKKFWFFPPLLAWIISIASLVIICAGITYSYNAFFKSDFQKLCEANGHFWLQSIPIKDGVALFPDTVTGCFLDVGLYHFADMREYKYFFQKREIVPEVSYKPNTPVAGQPTSMLITLSEIKDGIKVGPVTELGIYHDRLLHVMIAGEDLKTYAHIHSEDLGPITEEMKKQTSFPFSYSFPKAGRYALNIDYVVSGIEYTNVVLVKVAGSPSMEPPVFTPPANGENQPETKEFDGYQVTFTPPKKIKAGEKVKLEYHIEKNGKPVKDLEPYLGAAMHFGLVRNDLGRFFHAHGEASQPGSVWFQQLFGKYYKYHMHFAPDHFGPNLIAPPQTTKFTTPGAYTIFGEFKAEGKIVTTYFTVTVE